MSPPQPYRPDPFDGVGYEVVEDPGYEVVDTPPPAKPKPVAPVANPAPAAKAPPARPITAARGAPNPAAADPGFVVMDEPEDGVKGRAIQDAETVEIPRSKAKTTRVRVIDRGEDDRDDHRDEDRPRKKKRRTGSAVGSPADDEAGNAVADWVGPIFLMILGLALGIAGTVGLARQPDAMMNPALAATGMVVWQLITVPLTIIGLIVIGSLFGIEYGTFVHTIRNLAAMGFLVNGMMAALDWAGLPFYMYQPLIFMVGLGLFMALFRLDVWEALVTMFGLNIMSFVFKIVAVMILFAMLAHAAKKGEFDDGPPEWDRQGQFGDPDNGP
jgi:hypothetical protein